MPTYLMVVDSQNDCVLYPNVQSDICRVIVSIQGLMGDGEQKAQLPLAIWTRRLRSVHNAWRVHGPEKWAPLIATKQPKRSAGAALGRAMGLTRDRCHGTNV